MSDIQQILTDRFSAALTQALGQAADPLIRPSTNPQFGDYQVNVAMSLAKQLGQKPRDIAQKLLEATVLTDLCEKVEIAGPGFINLTLRQKAVEQQIAAMRDSERLGVPVIEQPQRVVVDYCGPNIAKQMHVGHLRSTVIGDCFARTLEFLGHDVIRQNHVGDWGLQMGMVTRALTNWGELPIELSEVEKQLLLKGQPTLDLLEKLYRAANARQEEQPLERQKMVAQTKALQQSPKVQLTAWQLARQITLDSVYQALKRLHVTLSSRDERGESFYSDHFAPMIAELLAAQHAQESQGADGIFLPEFRNKEGQLRPFIIQSRDGTYQYPTFDLAALRFRVQELHAERIIYTHDARQAEHFAMLFAAARKVGYVPKEVRTDYAPFGTILGTDKKPFKTRTGETVKLADLLDQAEQRARKIIDEKDPDLDAAQREAIAHTVAIGALKYADLSTDRIKDYVFDWDRMLAMDGNTAPYLQNAYVRIQSIFRKAKAQGLPSLGSADAITLAAPAERALALKLLQFAGTIAAVADSLEPHRLCNYLYELASLFHQFYEQCPVLNAETDATRQSRLALCDLVGRTLRQGLDLLGIGVVEQM